MNPGWIILLIGLAGGAFPSWWATSTYFQNVIAQEHESAQKQVIEQQEENRLALLAYAERIVKGDAQHDKNTRTIRTLNRELDGLHVSFPACPVPGTTEGGTDTDEAGRILSDGMADLFADFQKRTGRLVEEADSLNIDAIRQNAVVN